MAMFFCVFFWILCVQCPQTMDQVWIAALRADAEDDGYGEVCPNGQMPWPFLCIWGDGMQREGRQERGQGVAGGAIEREWQRMGSRGETEREWQGMDSQRMDESEGMAENGQQ